MYKVIGLLASFFFATAASAQSVSAASPTEERPSILRLESPSIKVAVQLPGMSHHFQQPRDTGKQWNERHAGIGLEWQYPRNNGVVVKYSAGVMRDSLSRWGAYAAAVWQKEMWATTTWQLDAGGGAFLFYRTLEFNGPHRLVPAPLPVVSLQHNPTGIGLNILAVPHFKLKDSEMPGVVYAQFTKAF